MQVRGEHDGLVVRAAGGDVAALEQLLLAHHDRLLRVIRRSLPIDMDRVISPEDVLQETLADAFRYAGTLQSRDEAGFAAWLTVIARNRVANARARHRALKRGQGRAGVAIDAESGTTAACVLEMLARHTQSPRSVAGDREYVTLMQQAIEDLPADYQRVLRLRYVEQADFAQIAREMNRGSGAVRMLALRALRHLRSLLPPLSRA